MLTEESQDIVELGKVTEITQQFSEGDPDGSPTSPGLNLTYPPIVPASE